MICCPDLHTPRKRYRYLFFNGHQEHRFSSPDRALSSRRCRPAGVPWTISYHLRCRSVTSVYALLRRKELDALSGLVTTRIHQDYGNTACRNRPPCNTAESAMLHASWATLQGILGRVVTGGTVAIRSVSTDVNQHRIECAIVPAVLCLFIDAAGNGRDQLVPQ